jgi:nicotinamidase-related amidase
VRSALLLIDVINPFDFPGSERLLRQARPIVPRIAALKRRAAREGVPVIYVNDNFGDWHIGLHELADRCRRSAGRPFVEPLLPAPGDYYVLKPRHSGFLSTSLDALLVSLEVSRVVVVGVATHICVLFTAMDAYMRGLEVVVPSDCVAAEERRATRDALALIGACSRRGCSRPAA